LKFPLEKIEKLTGYGLELLLENIYSDKYGLYLYVFQIFRKNTYKKIGRLTLRLGQSPEVEYLGNIGYGISKRFRRNGYAYKACKIILEFLPEHNITSVNITVNPDNLPSRKICVKLGGIPTGIVKGRENKLIYKIDLQQYNSSKCSGQNLLSEFCDTAKGMDIL